MDRIVLRGLRVEAFLGVTAAERARPQWVELDVELHAPLQEAGRADDLARTPDYAAVAEAVAAAIGGRSFHLLEAVAERAAAAAKRHAGVARVVVRARKFQPPVQAGLALVEVEIER